MTGQNICSRGGGGGARYFFLFHKTDSIGKQSMVKAVFSKEFSEFKFDSQKCTLEDLLTFKELILTTERTKPRLIEI